ncbi:MAG: haloacid dehalogenase type II [Pseudomonadota bacterium]
MTEPIEALIFDVFGTLVDWRRGVSSAVAAAFGPDAPVGAPVDAAAFADAWRAEYDPSMAPIREGRRGYVPLDLLHVENLARVLAARGLTGRLSGTDQFELARAWERLPPWEDSVAGLTQLRQRFLIAPCSNGSIGLMVRLARHADLPWDCVLGAEIARDYKPSPVVYQAACAALRLEPARVMMVAAHNGDLHAARAAGLRTGFFPRPLEHGPGQQSDLAAEADWDVVAGDFAGFAAVLSEGG